MCENQTHFEQLMQISTEKRLPVRNDRKDSFEKLELAIKNDFKATALRYHFFESLILAQDERWRRA